MTYKPVREYGSANTAFEIFSDAQEFKTRLGSHLSEVSLPDDIITNAWILAALNHEYHGNATPKDHGLFEAIYGHDWRPSVAKIMALARACAFEKIL
jgi:hypothetical protein